MHQITSKIIYRHNFVVASISTNLLGWLKKLLILIYTGYIPFCQIWHTAPFRIQFNTIT